MIMEWLRKASTPVVVTVIIVCGVLAGAVLAAYVLLSINGADTSDFRQWVQTIGISVILPLLGINTLASVSAARSSSNAEDQTNGHLTEKDETIAALRKRLEELER